MRSFTRFLQVLALLYASSSTTNATDLLQDNRDLQQGVNLCAAYDLIVPNLLSGYDSCSCDGRTLVCEYLNECKEGWWNNCADLKMRMDFTEPGNELIEYKANYTIATGLAPIKLILNVDPNLENGDGILGCTATYDYAEQPNQMCSCTACAEPFEISLDCTAYGNTDATTSGCVPVPVLSQTKVFVPFFTKGSGAEVAKSVMYDQSGAGSTSRWSRLAAGAACAAAIML